MKKTLFLIHFLTRGTNKEPVGLNNLLQFIIVSTGYPVDTMDLTLLRLHRHHKKQNGHHGRFSTLNKDFWWPSRAKCIIGRDLKFTGYIPHYKILTGNIFGLILKNKAFLCSHEKCLYLPYYWS